MENIMFYMHVLYNVIYFLDPGIYNIYIYFENVCYLFDKDKYFILLKIF